MDLDSQSLLVHSLLSFLSIIINHYKIKIIFGCKSKVAAYLAISGDWFHAIGLAAYGAIVVSQSDNLIRFILQKKMADTHPLITIFGVVIGLPLFGFMGVIFGPLLLSLFFLFVNMFKKEYLDLRNNLPSR